MIGLQVLPDLPASTAWLVLPAYRAGREIQVRVDLKAQRDFVDLPETLGSPAEKDAREYAAIQDHRVSVLMCILTDRFLLQQPVQQGCSQRSGHGLTSFSATKIYLSILCLLKS